MGVEKTKEEREIQQRIWQKQVYKEQIELQKRKEKREEEELMLRYRSIAASNKFFGDAMCGTSLKMGTNAVCYFILRKC